ncbi:MAG: hypothetical protein EOP87_11640 [Verrucomicrobiaceae bacterium]|nr:MAG: hypothetical protein EOP87_11640 [Verrucomicrobiaceae bacterium]
MSASAGMTVISLTDIARMRLDALSFFLFLYFLITWLVKLAWNQLASAFTGMPRLNYRRALGLVFVTGLLFYVVLTMISGARELLTPGAWEKQGVGYRQREQQGDLTKEARHKNLRTLQEIIWNYARSHEGNAPPSPLVPDMNPDDWLYPDGGLYCLMPGVKPGGGRQIIVYEPSAAGSRRFVLLADGTIEDRAEGTLKIQIEEQMRP